MTAARRPQPRPEIMGIAPYVGGESHLPGASRVLKLSSNEGAFGSLKVPMA
jgi:histidinol-phosphate aminotransferase